MKYYETLYLNCKNNGHIPELHNSDVVRFDDRNYHAYGSMVSLIGPMFFKAYRLHKCGILNKPYSVSFVIPKIEKFKDEDPEDNLERIKYILNEFVPPETGLIISIYEAPEGFKCITPFDFFIMWPFRNQWNKESAEDFVLIQDIEQIKTNNNYHWPRLKGSLDRIKNELTDLDIPYYFVDYKTPIADLFQGLSKCRAFFTFTGGIYYLAGLKGTPTISFGDSPFAQIDNYAEVKFPGKPFKDKVIQTCWGIHGLHAEKIIQLTSDNDMYQGPQKVVTNIGNVEGKKEIEILRKKIMEYC